MSSSPPAAAHSCFIALRGFLSSSANSKGSWRPTHSLRSLRSGLPRMSRTAAYLLSLENMWLTLLARAPATMLTAVCRPGLWASFSSASSLSLSSSSSLLAATASSYRLLSSSSLPCISSRISASLLANSSLSLSSWAASLTFSLSSSSRFLDSSSTLSLVSLLRRSSSSATPKGVRWRARPSPRFTSKALPSHPITSEPALPWVSLVAERGSGEMVPSGWKIHRKMPGLTSLSFHRNTCSPSLAIFWLHVSCFLSGSPSIHRKQPSWPPSTLNVKGSALSFDRCCTIQLALRLSV
mmetsp:Transcript_32715/g.82512  ORF Transcript_32715/g.82512 Transcript_32715/m.82512 type:complete len:296 (+) Transcript_32715:2955-3842(+)